MAGFVPAFLRPLNGEDVRVGLGIQSLSSVTLLVEPMTLRLSRGCIAEVNTATAAQAEVVLGGL